MENKNPPKKLKKKVPKEPLSGGGEKKLKAKGECPGDRDGLSPALGSVLAGTREVPSLSREAQGAAEPSPPPRAISPQLSPSCCSNPVPSLSPSLPTPIPMAGCSSAPLSQQKTRVTLTAKPNLPKAPRRSQCPCSR